MNRSFAQTSVFLFVASFLVYGCDIPPLKVDPETMHGVEQVAVISLLGEEIESENIDTKIFGKNHFVTSALGWSLNEKTIEVASHTLKTAGFEVVKIEYDYVGMWGKYKRSQDNRFFNEAQNHGYLNAAQIIRNDLEAIRNKYAVDGFLLIVPGQRDPFCSGRKPCIDYGNYGFGLNSQFGVGTTAYISAKTYFIDSKSLELASQNRTTVHLLLPKAFRRVAYSYYNERERGGSFVFVYTKQQNGQSRRPLMRWDCCRASAAPI